MLSTTIEGSKFTLLKDNLPLLTSSFERPLLAVSIDKNDLSKHYHNLPDVAYDETHKMLNFHSGGRSITFALSEEDDLLVLKPVKQSHPFTKIRFRFPADPEEPVFGCGGVAAAPNLRGRKINIYTSRPNSGERVSAIDIIKKYIIRRDQSKPLVALPAFFTGSHSLFMTDFGGRTSLNFTHRDYHEVEIHGVPENICIAQPKTITDIHQKQQKLVGTRFQFPTWYESGIIAGVTGGSGSLLETIDILKASDIGVAALFVRDWTGTQQTGSGEREFWDWIWNRELYPHLDEVLNELSEKKVHILCYANPHLSTDGLLYAEASKLGFLIKRSDGANLLTDLGGFMVGHVDLTNPEASQWLEDILSKNIFEFGFSGIISDHSGFLPQGSTLYDGTDEHSIHNFWPCRWTQIIRKAAKRHGINPVTILNSGSVGASFSAITANGTKVDWAHGYGLQSALNEMLSLSLSGIGISHCDFETFAGALPEAIVADQLIHWAELSAFTPVMRLAPFDDKMVSLYQSDPGLLPKISKLIELRSKLSPYLNSCLKDYYTKSIPPMRHLWEMYPSLNKSFDIADQFMSGPELLVAPITFSNAGIREVLLPEGDVWVSLADGKDYEPGLHTFDITPGTPIAFYKKGGKHEKLFASLASIFD